MSFRPGNHKSRRASLWSTASIRLTLTLSVIFGLGGAALIAGIDFALFRFVEAEVREDLNHQMEVMRDDEGHLGGNALVTMLGDHTHNREVRRYLFLVIAKDGATFSNGLTRNAANSEGFRRNFPNKNRPARWPDQRPNMLVLSHMTPDGTFLAIGRDIQHLDELLGGVRSFALWSALGVIALALGAGLVTGYLFLRRLEGVNIAVARISSGDSAERLPAIGFGREFDDLARNLNLMLDRQEAMMEALRTVSEGIAHDLRTPLGRLRNRLEELETYADNADNRQAAILSALQEIHHITSLFEALLTLSKIEGGTIIAETAAINANDLIENVAELYRPTIEDAGGTILVTPCLSDRQPLVQGDMMLLIRALSNLVENAMIHSDGRAEISMQVARQEGAIAIIVADHGPGIPPAERKNVLKRFYRMDRSRSRDGSGIGLAMCAAVAHHHGGELVLSDTRPGTVPPGLKISLVLPAQ